jgi:hypothetical protein
MSGTLFSNVDIDSDFPVLETQVHRKTAASSHEWEAAIRRLALGLQLPESTLPILPSAAFLIFSQTRSGKFDLRQHHLDLSSSSLILRGDISSII